MKRSLLILGVLLSIPYNLVNRDEPIKSQPQQEIIVQTSKYSTPVQMSLRNDLLKPCDTSSAKTYMDRKAITDETSEQHAFIEENMEARNGHWVDREGYIGVALGSWFGDIGTRWIFYLSSGEVLYTVKIEHKAYIHTIDGCQHIEDGSVIEFVIDSETNPYWVGSNNLIVNGNYNNLPQFEGAIEYVKKEKH